ncbi:MAG: magnesium and cobalt transport protein CorA [Firmicutes bacterium HGW-Firmicutes-12]|jgi:magnesium transporter|nr:MAG: magnesium and cobalt transport protein CorA [Firmicutes bacterium HGW-Firmicutes-12]
MIRTISIGESSEISVTESWEGIEETYRGNKKILWIDILEPNKEELNVLGKVFGYDELNLEDCGEYSKNPKINEHEDYLFLVTHFWNESEDLLFPKLNIFISNRTLITVHYYPIAELNKYWDTLLHRQFEGPITVDFLLYNVLDGVVDTFHTIIEKIEDQIEDIEEKVILNDLEGALVNITQIRRKLIYSRRQLSSEIKMIEKLLHPDIEYFTDKSRIYLKDIMERLDRVLHYADVNRELVSSLFDTYLSVLSNRTNTITTKQNVIMQRLTIITAIFLPLTLLAGIYGMNFIYIPELSWHYGYFTVLLIMLSLGIGLYLYFKKVGWLD